MLAVTRSPPPADAAAVAAAVAAADAAETHIARAKVGLIGALIWPLSVEKRFWTSKVFRTAAEEHDSVHLLMRLASEWLQMFLVQPALPPDVARPFRAISVKSAALVLVHMAFKIVAPGVYWRYRWISVAHFRLSFLLIMLALAMTVRATVGRLGVVSALAADLMKHLLMEKAVKGSTTWTTARSVFLISMGHLSFLHGMMPVVPFLLDIPVYIAYLASIFRFMSAPMADIFTAPKYSGATLQLCRALATLPTRQSYSPIPQHSSPTAGPCGVQHVWLILLFFQLLVGFLLPLYVSYSMERSLKLRFLRRERQRLAAAAATAAAPTAPSTSATPGGVSSDRPATLAAGLGHPTRASSLPSHPLVSKARTAQHQVASLFNPHPSMVGVLAALHWLRGCCVHACVVGLLAMVSWQLVVELHVPLAKYVKLLDFPGAHYGWYWELVCSGDGPCCPA